MRTLLIIGGVIIAVVIAGAVAVVAYFYLTSRALDQSLAREVRISNEWLELPADPPLGASRQVQELAIVVPNHRFDRSEKLPTGEFRLPDGHIVIAQIEGIDTSGTTIPFHHTGFTYAERDFVTYRPSTPLADNSIAKIRIRSDLPFSAEEILWRNRNPK